MKTFLAFVAAIFGRGGAPRPEGAGAAASASSAAPVAVPIAMHDGAPILHAVPVLAVGDGPSEAELLRTAMDRMGIMDPDDRAGIAAISMGESAMKGHVETGYAHTANSRIRQVFGSRVSALTDAQLNDLKASDRDFFERVYGGEWGRANLGNVALGDGYRYRGRGFIQLTGRGNYARYGGMIGRRQEILDNPDLANDPAISALLTCAYIKDRFKGGGFEGMMRCVGNNTPDIAARKRAYFARFKASGEFAAR